MLKKRVILGALSMSIVSGITANAVFAVPPKPGNEKKPTYNAVYEYKGSSSEKNKTYTSDNGSEVIILSTAGTANFHASTFTKTGDDKDEQADFYGTNAAILAKDKGKVKLIDSTITTNGKYANAAFAYGNGTIDLEKTVIETSGNNSGGIMVAGGGTINADNLDVKTSGNSSAAIRSDRGGGTITVEGGTYKTTGVGSPVIYSTADVMVKNAKMESSASEGVVVEGANSVILDNVTLTDNNTKLNGNSETYKNIFLYQSMSGDAATGTGSITIRDSKINTSNGDVFFVTNTSATIDLRNVVFSNTGKDQAFIRSQAGKWGNKNKNGGETNLTVTNCELNGDIILDNLSTLQINMLENVSYTGAINSNNKAKSIVIALDSTSQIILTADSYVDELDNRDSTNMNIYGNGHKLYVNKKEAQINQTSPKQWQKKTDKEAETTVETTEEKDETEKDKTTLYIIFGIAAVAFVVVLFVTVKLFKKSR